MKKSVLAVAVAAALPAFAQAASNVQLYGILDTSIGFTDNGAANSNNALVVNSGAQSTSRMGIKGEEDLGKGLKAIFNIEAQVFSDTGDSQGNNFWQRRSVVGLKGNFGEVRLGRDYTPGFSAAGQTDIMGYGLYGNWLNYTAGVTANTAISGVGGIATRASNAVHYTSPAFGNTNCMASTNYSTECNAFSGGLSFAAMYATGENLTGSSNSGDVLGGAVVYKGGPLVAQAYYHDITVDAAAADSIDQYGAGAQYYFSNNLRVAANWGESKGKGGTLAGVKHRAMAIGAGIKLGGGELLGNIIDREVKASVASDISAMTFGIAYTYPLSKRTNVYATYGQTNNDANGAFGLNASGYAIAAGGVDTNVKAFAVGVRHRF